MNRTKKYQQNYEETQLKKDDIIFFNIFYIRQKKKNQQKLCEIRISLLVPHL